MQLSKLQLGPKFKPAGSALPLRPYQALLVNSWLTLQNI